MLLGEYRIFNILSLCVEMIKTATGFVTQIHNAKHYTSIYYFVLFDLKLYTTQNRSLFLKNQLQ